MSEQFIQAILLGAIGAAGLVLAAAVPAYINMMSKMRDAATDSAAARTASERAESSMNNSPHTVTERLLGMTSALDDIKTAQAHHATELRGVRADIGILQNADSVLRRDLSDHLETSAKVARRVDDTTRTLDRILPDIERLSKPPIT